MICTTKTALERYKHFFNPAVSLVSVFTQSLTPGANSSQGQ